MRREPAAAMPAIGVAPAPTFETEEVDAMTSQAQYLAPAVMFVVGSLALSVLLVWGASMT